MFCRFARSRFASWSRNRAITTEAVVCKTGTATFVLLCIRCGLLCWFSTVRQPVIGSDITRGTNPDPSLTPVATVTEWVLLPKVKVPSEWRDELREAAAANGVAQADLIRMALRAFLSRRYEHG